MNFVLTILACLIFAWVDYWLYPPANKNKWEGWYRALQTTLQIALVVSLWHFYSWIPAASFMILWWVFGCDLLFYGFCELEIIKDNPGKGSWANDSKAGYYWAWWTPLGLYRSVENRIKSGVWSKPKFTQDELYIQAVIGFAVVIIMQAISRY